MQLLPAFGRQEGEISVFQGQHKEFQDSLGYKDPVSKTETNKQKRERIKIVAHRINKQNMALRLPITLTSEVGLSIGVTRQAVAD